MSATGHNTYAGGPVKWMESSSCSLCSQTGSPSRQPSQQASQSAYLHSAILQLGNSAAMVEKGVGGTRSGDVEKTTKDPRNTISWGANGQDSQTQCPRLPEPYHLVSLPDFSLFIHDADGARSDNEQEPVVESLDQITVEREWNRLLLHGPLPSPRSKHAAVAIGRKMFVTGGFSPQGKLNDVQVFHAENLTWESLDCQFPYSDLTDKHDAPCRSCTGHGLVLWENQFVLVGCQTKSTSKTVAVYSLNLSSRSWSSLSPKGNAPAARTGHTVVQMASMLVLFGGEDMKGHTHNDIYILDLKTLLWLPLETSGTKPSSRRDHCAASYSDRYLWIFGGKSKTSYANGTYCLDFRNMEWTKVKTRGRSPMARAGHSGMVAGNKWYIVGGESRGNEVLKTLAFNLDTHEWSQFGSIRPGSPLANDGISVVRIQSKGRTFAVAFGGHDSNRIYVMLLPSTGSPIAETHSDASSGHSNSFSSTHSVKFVFRDSVSSQSVRTSNASSADGSTAQSTISLGESILRSDKESTASGFDDQAVANLLVNRETILASQASSTATTASDEEADYQIEKASHNERPRLTEGVQPVQTEENSSLVSNSGNFSDSLGVVLTSRNPNPGTGPYYCGVSRDVDEILMSTSINRNPPSGTRESEISGDLNEGFVSTSRNPNPLTGMHESEISGDLNERLVAALKLNEALHNRLVQTHDAKVELEEALNENMTKTDILEQQVLNLLMSKAEEEWKLEEARKKLEGIGRKLNSPSRIQQDVGSKLQSTSREEERVANPISLRTKLFEEADFNVETDTSYETRRRLEEAESKLAALTNSHHLIESKLQTATREKRELVEKAVTAVQMMEEARSACKTLRAGNLRLEQELLAAKAILADTQEELQAKQVELQQATAGNFQLQVEMHELSHKFSGS